MDSGFATFPSPTLWRIEQTADGTWRALVPEPPEDGRANAAVIELLAEHFDVPKRSLRIVRGHTGRQKTIELNSEK